MLSHISAGSIDDVPGFIDDVLYQAEWRATKAVEYPNDSRNQRSADALKKLAAWLKGLPADEPILVRLDAALDRLYADPDVLATFLPTVPDRLGRYEFHNGQSVDTPEDFVLDLIMEIDDHLESEGQMDQNAKPTIENAKCMTVEALIELLTKYDPDSRVMIAVDVDENLAKPADVADVVNNGAFVVLVPMSMQKATTAQYMTARQLFDRFWERDCDPDSRVMIAVETGKPDDVADVSECGPFVLLVPAGMTFPGRPAGAPAGWSWGFQMAHAECARRAFPRTIF